MKNLTIYPRLFAFIALGFVLATIVGTVSHEMGHIAVAKSLGYKTKLYYASMNYNFEEKLDSLEAYHDKHKSAIYAKQDSPEKTYFKKAYEQIGKERYYINWGGPAQTMIVGTFGFIMLWLRRKKITEYGMKVADWIFAIIAFFWSRQLFNFLHLIFDYIGSKGTNLSTRGDEVKISRYLRLPLPTVNVITATIAIILLVWVVFIIIPKSKRLTFIISGLGGSALGWMIWMYWMGPVLLP
ncbi:hypothetical protein [Flavobacterium psychrotrophum]|uniref:hypothetical protein n=1 Tax=Flavobacterium psychrotrophum TaxID=2294119 RepID=UPI000E30CBD9|nr:hypothetical protein [Flavobacterium psychrotrophum]